MTSLAPVLSATSSRVCIWIMGLSRSARSTTEEGRGQKRSLGGRGLTLAGQGLLGTSADDPDDPPALELRQRAGFHDLDDVPQVGLVGLVVGMADRASLEELAVLRVRHQPLELDAAGLVHFVGRHDADLRLVTGPTGVLGAGGGRVDPLESITADSLSCLLT